MEFKEFMLKLQNNVDAFEKMWIEENKSRGDASFPMSFDDYFDWKDQFLAYLEGTNE